MASDKNQQRSAVGQAGVNTASALRSLSNLVTPVLPAARAVPGITPIGTVASLPEAVATFNPISAVNAARTGTVAALDVGTDFVEGLLGRDPNTLPRASNTALNPNRPAPSTQVRALAQPKQTARQKEPTQTDGAGVAGVLQSLADLATRRQQVTPQDQVAAAVSQILSQPFSIRQLQAASSVLPMATKSTPGRRDQILGQLQGLADMQYQASLDAADAIPTQTERDQVIQAATDSYRKNLLDTLGIDPSKQALAQILASAQQQDQE